MVKEIVILPTCFNEKNFSAELIQVFKDVNSHPIFITDFKNSNWINNIKDIDSNQNIPDALRKALQIFLKKIKNRIILKNSSQDDFTKILNWLKEIKLNNSIDCTLITDDDSTLCKKQEILSFQNIKDIILEDSIKWDSIKVLAKEIKKTEVQTEKILRMILNNTDKAILVDGYFNPTKNNFKKSLHLISKHLGQNSIYQDEDKKIIIHAAKKMTNDVELFKKNLPAVLIFFKSKYSIDYEFYLWNYIHDRSFLTDKMCLESTSGMEIIEDNTPGDNINTKWLFLPNSTSQNQLDKYDITMDCSISDIIWKYTTTP